MNLQNSSDIEISYAKEESLQSFHQSLDLVAREKIYIEMIEAPPFEKIKEHQRQLIQNNFPAYQAIHKGRVVGWADISGSANPRFAHRGFLGMGLIKEYRGIGLGKKLLHAAIEHAKQIGLEKIELEVYSSNTTARTLYQKMGFQVVGYKKNNRKLEGRYFDCVLMDLFLANS